MVHIPDAMTDDMMIAFLLALSHWWGELSRIACGSMATGMCCPWADMIVGQAGCLPRMPMLAVETVVIQPHRISATMEMRRAMGSRCRIIPPHLMRAAHVPALWTDDL
ncbi:hypothetical protein GHA01_11720 [Novacetimonas hansenii]|uniref:Uncharacterized protein n=2 Tax=Novacetimonas hansenii TaxID=436 RepID=A0ABQ0SDZ9_NOVHA|nr:hypothetical protein GXY_07970 [Novacetimonas hansenii ATCC 23769]GAN82496.1 hypothetical protein Gaha_0016_029 [Novacetimonas hansenii JCM 7643]GBQ56713.1 hypothetical protein AA0243_1285 [Novacetimonas hansenii NRIC 0243]GEC63323.1 hypothetical protein GHA01_11720 [Novacetimonas hansenii]